MKGLVFHSMAKCVANGSPATHQTPRQQGGTVEDGHIHLTVWTLSVAEIKKKEKTARSSRMLSECVSLDYIFDFYLKEI